MSCSRKELRWTWTFVGPRSGERPDTRAFVTDRWSWLMSLMMIRSGDIYYKTDAQEELGVTS